MTEPTDRPDETTEGTTPTDTQSTPQGPADKVASAPPPGNPPAAADSTVTTMGDASDDDLATALEAARAKANENWERYLRATAEQDNIRKRAERDIDNARKFALERFAKDLVAVMDNLDLGLKSAETTAADQGPDQAVLEGIKLTRKILLDTFQKHGVTPIDPAGAVFDPALHEAMSAVPSADHAPNTVMDVIQRGFRLHDRVLRPAMVIVAQPPADNG
ncbi:MAG: nucleotide exchange factor GrpE [Oceanococcaceae bacterium]